MKNRISADDAFDAAIDTVEVFFNGTRAVSNTVAEAAGSAHESLAARMESRVAELERRADRTALACQALWEILKLKTGVTESEVFSKMEEIDRRDGRADGRISSQVQRCGRCNRSVNSARPVCLYCGHANPAGTIAR